MKKLLLLPLILSYGFALENSDDLSSIEKEIKKLEKKIKKTSKKLNKVKAHDASDNIKWDVDFRTSVDKIDYTRADDSTVKNSALFTNRLILGGAYAPEDNSLFRMSLSYLKNYGDSANHSQSNSIYGKGFADFDWVVNENSLDGKVRVKEAYWLYSSDTFFDKDIKWTASFGRRPATDGLLINYREDIDPKSPLAHTVNVNFDGASFKFYLDKVLPFEGAWIKFCIGRGLTNAKVRFDFSGTDYSHDETLSSDIDLKGFIFVPYDNGQYSIYTSYARATNLVGFTNKDMAEFNFATMGYDPGSLNIQDNGYPALMSEGSDYYNAYMQYMMGSIDQATFAQKVQDVQNTMSTTYKQLDGTSATPTNILNNDFTISNITPTTQSKIPTAQIAYKPELKDFGDYEYFTVAFKADGIGDEVSEFLDNTKAFFSIATSRTIPKSGMSMLGSNKSQSGYSFWFGFNFPSTITQNARWGFEFNKGSKYWRSMTYAEDTMSASKIAARGEAIELYYFQKLTKSLSSSIRYTRIYYDYTGSQGFFGDEGTPYSIEEAIQRGLNPIKKATDIRLEISYRF